MDTQRDSDETPAGGADITHEIARQLAAEGPPGWETFSAEFSLTVAAEAVRVVFTTGDRSVRLDPSATVLALVREQRELSAGSPAGPWWRLLLAATNTGTIEVDHDYGDEPFPGDQLLPREAYQEDQRVHRRRRLPVWLAAYLGPRGRQARSPRTAANQVVVDLVDGVRGEPVPDLLPLPLMWARWATIAAAFTGVGSERGPRIEPARALFEGARRSGSTLVRLPGDRAVLSGGVWNAPGLDAAYNGSVPLPRLYAGAPEWLTDDLLNFRAAEGLLSFCFWWDGTGWFRGESPPPAELPTAFPAAWTLDSVTQVVTGVVDGATESAVGWLMASAEGRAVTRDRVVDLFAGTGRVDVDAAMHQFFLAGLLAERER